MSDVGADGVLHRVSVVKQGLQVCGSCWKCAVMSSMHERMPASHCQDGVWILKAGLSATKLSAPQQCGPVDTTYGSVCSQMPVLLMQAHVLLL